MTNVIPFALESHAVRIIEIDGEPRVRDLDVAEQLGLTDLHSIRRLIEGNRTELESYGPISDRRSETPDHRRRGRPGREFWLNEGQALVICALSRTSQAAVVRRALIAVFMAWRHRRLGPQMHRVTADEVDARAITLGERRVAVAMVGQCARLFGQAAARRLWVELGLPAPATTPGAAAPLPGVVGEADGHAVLSALAVAPFDAGLRVGEAVRGAAARTLAPALCARLRHLGLWVNPWGRHPGFVAVASQHTGLKAILAGTVWAKQGWREALRALPGAVPAGGAIRFGTVHSRATLVPVEAFPAALGCPAPGLVHSQE